MRKKILAICLGAVMALTITSCGKPDADGDDYNTTLYVDEADEGGLEIGLEDAAPGDFAGTGIEINEDHPFMVISSDFEGDGYVELRYVLAEDEDIDTMPDLDYDNPYRVLEIHGHEGGFFDMEPGFYHLKVTVFDSKLTGKVFCREGKDEDGYTPAGTTNIHEEDDSDIEDDDDDTEDDSDIEEAAGDEADSGNTDYSVAVDPSVADVKAVEEYAKKAKEAILDEDIDWIVSNARYPFSLVGQEIEDADALKAALEADDSPIKSEAFKSKVTGLDTTDLFANYQGVMLGDGEIWFGEFGEDDAQGLYLFTINGV